MITLTVIIVVLIVFLVKNNEYKSGRYYETTGSSYLSVAYNKGKLGEYLIYDKLKKHEENGARFLFNVYVPKTTGGTTEIDVLMICTKGIFVFESKNYSGWIFGNEYQKNWYQTVRSSYGIKKHQFYNPVMQNRSHIRHLGSFLGEDIPMYSVIVFSERCTLKDIQISSNNVIVAQRNLLEYAVADISNWAEDCLNENEIADIYCRLSSLLVDSTEKPEAISADAYAQICPRCGGHLVLRTAQKGKNKGSRFYGCSNYPSCRYIKNR